MKLLLAGFQPFGGETVNPALEAVRRVPDTLPGVSIFRVEAPVIYQRATEVVTAEMKRLRPEAVLCVGQAGGSAAMAVERIAINMDDAALPDNANQRREGTPIDPAGEAAYFSTLPVKAMVQSIREAGVPAALSNSAGTYVCNHLLYGVLRHIRQHGLNTRAGFIHVPFIPGQVAAKGGGQPSMALSDIVRGLEAAIAAIAAEYSQ